MTVNEAGEMYFPPPKPTKKQKAAQARTDEARMDSVRRENQLEKYAQENEQELQRVNSRITHLHRNDPPLPEDKVEREGLREYRTELQQRRIWINLDLLPIQEYSAAQKEYDRLDERIKDEFKRGRDARANQFIKLRDDIELQELRSRAAMARSNVEERMQGGEAEKFYTLPPKVSTGTESMPIPEATGDDMPKVIEAAEYKVLDDEQDDDEAKVKAKSKDDAETESKSSSSTPEPPLDISASEAQDMADVVGALATQHGAEEAKLELKDHDTGEKATLELGEMGEMLEGIGDVGKPTPALTSAPTSTPTSAFHVRVCPQVRGGRRF